MIENTVKSDFLSSNLYNKIKESYPNLEYLFIPAKDGEEQCFVGIKLNDKDDKKNQRSVLSSTEENGIELLIIKLKAEFEKSPK